MDKKNIIIVIAIVVIIVAIIALIIIFTINQNNFGLAYTIIGVFAIMFSGTLFLVTRKPNIPEIVPYVSRSESTITTLNDEEPL